MKNLLIVAGLGGLAYILFGSKSPSPLFTNPKIAIPDKTGDIETTPKKGTPIVVKEKGEVNSSGEINTLQSYFN